MGAGRSWEQRVLLIIATCLLRRCTGDEFSQEGDYVTASRTATSISGSVDSNTSLNKTTGKGHGFAMTTTTYRLSSSPVAEHVTNETIATEASADRVTMTTVARDNRTSTSSSNLDTGDTLSNRTVTVTIRAGPRNSTVWSVPEVSSMTSSSSRQRTESWVTSSRGSDSTTEKAIGKSSQVSRRPELLSTALKTQTANGSSTVTVAPPAVQPQSSTRDARTIAIIVCCVIFVALAIIVIVIVAFGLIRRRRSPRRLLRVNYATNYEGDVESGRNSSSENNNGQITVEKGPDLAFENPFQWFTFDGTSTSDGFSSALPEGQGQGRGSFGDSGISLGHNSSLTAHEDAVTYRPGPCSDGPADSPSTSRSSQQRQARVKADGKNGTQKTQPTTSRPFSALWRRSKPGHEDGAVREDTADGNGEVETRGKVVLESQTTLDSDSKELPRDTANKTPSSLVEELKEDSVSVDVDAKAVDVDGRLENDETADDSIRNSNLDKRHPNGGIDYRVQAPNTSTTPTSSPPKDEDLVLGEENSSEQHAGELDTKESLGSDINSVKLQTATALDANVCDSVC